MCQFGYLLDIGDQFLWLWEEFFLDVNIYIWRRSLLRARIYFVFVKKAIWVNLGPLSQVLGLLLAFFLRNFRSTCQLFYIFFSERFLT